MRPRLYDTALVLKGAHAVIELIGACVIFLMTPTALVNFATNMLSQELSEDPNDILANLILSGDISVPEHVLGSAALFLFVSAIVNGLVVAALMKRVVALYPVAFFVLSAFVTYQATLYMRSSSPFTLALIAYDCLFMWLIWREYRRMLAYRAEAP